MKAQASFVSPLQTENVTRWGLFQMALGVANCILVSRVSSIGFLEGKNPFGEELV
jgi:hypothetical protein